MKPWKREAVEHYGWWPLLGSPVAKANGPRVYWYQATMGDGIANWECPCGASGYSYSITWSRFRLWRHLQRCDHRPSLRAVR